jgi:uncharacterized protein involved in exopolysaccharide biosynthesis
VKEVAREDHNPTSLIFQRLQAQESFHELKRQRMHHRIAGNVRTIWSERTFLVRISALGLLGGILIAFSISPRYTATARLMPPDNQAGSSLAFTAASLAAARGGGGIGEIAGDLLGLNKTSEIFVGILNSRTVQNHIIETFDLKRVYGVARIIDARQQLSRSVAISIDHKNQMITISVTDRSPQRAADIAASYAEELNRLVSDLSTSSARRERIFLEGRLAQVSQDLESAEQEFSHFSSKNGAIDIKEQSRAMLDVAGALQGQLISAQAELEGLRQIYSDSHVRVRAQKARIAELQSQLSNIGGKDQQNTLGPETQAADLYPSIRKLPLLGVTYADLYRRTKVQEAIYEVLTQEYELAKVQEARETPTVKILDAPEVPEIKDFPPRKLIALSSTGVAFFGGIVIVLATKSWDERDPDDLSKAIAKEIWVDLKQRRFLNSVAAASSAPAPDAQYVPQLKRGIFSFLGWSKVQSERNGSSSSAADNASQHDFDTSRSDTSGSRGHGLHDTA